MSSNFWYTDVNTCGGKAVGEGDIALDEFKELKAMKVDFLNDKWFAYANDAASSDDAEDMSSEEQQKHLQQALDAGNRAISACKKACLVAPESANQIVADVRKCCKPRKDDSMTEIDDQLWDVTTKQNLLKELLKKASKEMKEVVVGTNNIQALAKTSENMAKIAIKDGMK